jgi:Rieske Fe-S protein
MRRFLYANSQSLWRQSVSISSIRASDIPAGQGLTGEIGGRAVAVYNSGDRLIVLENLCTHMGCQTDWNAFEKTWDCPCHGSRYQAGGLVIRGPATGPLAVLEHQVENDEIILLG